MPIIGQGLRRSGTTIVYDIISQDERIKCFYEPLSLARPSIGGGSKVSQVDVSLNLRQIRKEFCDIKKISLDHKVFNFGAPTNYILESDREHLNYLIKEYLAFIIKKHPNSFLKFTRASLFINDVYNLSPDSLFLHIVKNPARWVASHISKTSDDKIIKDPNLFFNLKKEFNNWSQENISNLIINKYDKKFLSRPAYFKLLYLWNFLNNKTKNDAYKLYKNNYIQIYNDDLYINYKNYLDKIYDYLKINPKIQIYDWCLDNVKKPKEILFSNDTRWAESFEELGIDLSYLR